MVTINRANAISYLAELYKTAGANEFVLPNIFTSYIVNVCSGCFEKVDREWYYIPPNKIPVNELTVKSRVEVSELSSTFKHHICDVAAYVKWDLIYQKLKELNHA